MRYSIFALLALAGCVSQPGERSPWLPTEFHLIATRSDFDSDGSIAGGPEPWQLQTSGRTRGYTIGGGFTWAIGRQAAPVRAHYPQSVTPDPIVVSLPVAITVKPVAAAPVVAIAAPDPAPDPDPDHQHPLPVTIMGMTDEAWLKLFGALTLLATAVAGYIGRQRIPYLRDYTREGRAKRASEPRDTDEDLHG